MRIMNQELVTNVETQVQEIKLEAYVPVDLLDEKILSMGEEVATIYVGRLFVSQLKEAIVKARDPSLVDPEIVIPE